MRNAVQLACMFVTTTALLTEESAHAQPAVPLEPSVVLEPVAAPADPYVEAFARAAEHERIGDLIAAARDLEAVVAQYPQDYDIVLRIGSLYLQAKRPADAERYYRAARERSPGAVDARLGLAWSLAGQSRCDEARPELQALLASQPDLASARQCATVCAAQPNWSFAPGLAFSVGFYPNHPDKAFGASAAASIELAHRSGWLFSGTYRFHYVTPRSSTATTQMMPGGPPAPSATSQHDAFLEAGYGTKVAGISLQYGLIVDPTGFTRGPNRQDAGAVTPSSSHHVGISGRWSPYGDILLNAAASFYGEETDYTGQTVLRAEPSWRLPIAFGLSVQPGAGVQWLSATRFKPPPCGPGSPAPPSARVLCSQPSSFLGTARLTLLFERSFGVVYVGGKLGNEQRPAYMALHLVNNTHDLISTYGIWAGGSVNIGESLRINASYALDNLKVVSEGDSTPPVPQQTAATAHFITIGMTTLF